MLIDHAEGAWHNDGSIHVHARIGPAAPPRDYKKFSPSEKARFDTALATAHDDMLSNGSQGPLLVGVMNQHCLNHPALPRDISSSRVPFAESARRIDEMRSLMAEHIFKEQAHLIPPDLQTKSPMAETPFGFCELVAQAIDEHIPKDRRPSHLLVQTMPPLPEPLPTPPKQPAKHHR